MLLSPATGGCKGQGVVCPWVRPLALSLSLRGLAGSLIGLGWSLGHYLGAICQIPGQQSSQWTYHNVGCQSFHRIPEFRSERDFHIIPLSEASTPDQAVIQPLPDVRLKKMMPGNHMPLAGR